MVLFNFTVGFVLPFSSRKISLGPFFSVPSRPASANRLQKCKMNLPSATNHVYSDWALPTVAPRIRNKVTHQACCNPAARPLGAAAKMQNEPTNCYKSRTPTGPLPNGCGSDNVTKAFVELVAILLLLLLPGRPRKYKTNPPTATNHVLRLDHSLRSRLG